MTLKKLLAVLVSVVLGVWVVFHFLQWVFNGLKHGHWGPWLDYEVNCLMADEVARFIEIFQGPIVLICALLIGWMIYKGASGGGAGAHK